MASPMESSVPQVDFNSSKLVIGQSGDQLSGDAKSTPDQTLMSVPPLRDRYFAALVPHDEVAAMCRQFALSSEVDGEIQRLFLLTEIDHWNSSYEKVVLLTEKSIVWVKFDFVTRKYKHSRRLPYSSIVKVVMGDVVFPPKSVAPPRRHGAVRLYWGDPAQVGVTQRWNPFSSDTIPYLTLAHHPLHYCEQDRNDPTFDVDAFYAEVANILRENYPNVPMVAEPIVVNLLHGLASTVFNQSGLGYSKDRNGASF